jgi:uncharacterized protein (DUF4415 family)
MGIVRYKLDLNKPATLSEEAKARFDAIKDEDIDYSDIPELDDAFFENAMPIREFMAKINAPKSSVTIRYDADIIEWFKANTGTDGKRGKGYQTAMNAVLRSYVEAQKASLKKDVK